jgi:hypothetical protein
MRNKIELEGNTAVGKKLRWMNFALEEGKSDGEGTMKKGKIKVTGNGRRGLKLECDQIHFIEKMKWEGGVVKGHIERKWEIWVAGVSQGEKKWG